MEVLAMVAAIFGLLSSAAGQCDLYQNVGVGEVYDIKSPGYPNRYSAGSSCRWTAISPTGTTLLLQCGPFNIPSSPNCQSDVVLVSPSGGQVSGDKHTYCGQGSFSVTSVTNRLTIELYSSTTSTGGLFLCNVTAISCSCGMKKQNRIVGGTETGVNEYPMMAGLVDSDQKRLYCGATIISQEYALTAAHCLINKVPAKIGLLVGEHNISTGSDTTATKLLLISKFISHPQYNSVSQVNDLALIKTQTLIPNTRDISPACLPFRYKQTDFTGQIVRVLGWGTTEFAGPSSDVLLQADLQVITNTRCKSFFGDGVSEKQMCTHWTNRDACQSDSGGPVLWQDSYTGRVHLVGVISYGIGCATETPGVNTRVTSYLDWILSVTGDGYCRM